MRQAAVYRNNVFAGTLTEYSATQYEFRYDEQYRTNPETPAISLTFPKNVTVFTAEYLFPFFFNMLSEGVNRTLQCTRLHIDEMDSFGLLLATAHDDTIGAITVKPIEVQS